MKKITSKVKSWIIKALSAMGATSLIIVPTTTLTACKNVTTTSEDKKQSSTKIASAVNVSKKFMQKYSKTQFYNTYNNNNALLKEFVVQNISSFASGSVNQIKNNLNAKLVTINNELYLDLEIHSGYWYKNNKLQYETLKQQIKLYGFGSELLPDAGGQFNGLNVDKNLKLVDVLMSRLKINGNFNISKLTDNDLNNIYKTTKNYENLSCKILEDSSTKNGLLKLHVTGLFNNENYDNIVTISNFTKPVNHVFVNNVKLNLMQWFIDGQPTQTMNPKNIENITSNDFINKYIDSGIIQKFGSDHKIMSFKEAKENGYIFKFIKPTLDKSNTNFTLRLESINFQHKKYQNGQWIDDVLAKLEVKEPANLNYINIPKNDESLKFLLDQTTINESIIKNYYPSYFLAQAIYANFINFNYPAIHGLIQNDYIEHIRKTYYPNVGDIIVNIMNNPHSIYADDSNGVLEFSLEVSLDDKKTIHTKRFIFQNKAKNISSFIIEQQNADHNNLLVLRTGEQKHWANKIIKDLKKHDSNTINNFFNDASKTDFEKVNTKLNLNWLANLFHSIRVFSNDETWNLENPNLQRLFENVGVSENNYDGLYAFGKEITFTHSTGNMVNLRDNGALDIKSGLYRFDQDNEFIVRSINYKLTDTSGALWIRHNSNVSLTLRIPYQVEIGIGEHNIVHNSWISITLLQSEWNSIK